LGLILQVQNQFGTAKSLCFPTEIYDFGAIHLS